MADILQIGREYRKEILRLDSEAAKDLVRYYGNAYKDIEKSLDSLLTKIQERRKNGERVSRSWLNDETRYRELLAQIQLQIDKFGEQAERTIKKGQEGAVSLATDGAKDMIRAGVLESTVIASTGYTFHRVPVESLEYLVGYLGNGAPLGKLLGALGDDAAARAKDVLTNAVIKGLNPRQTARQMRDAFGGNLSRVLTVARTEQLRSYRQASTENYRANEDVLEGWIRFETLDDLTCVICIDEHGRFYPLGEDFETHPNCRGTQIPKVKGVERQIQTGSEWFEKQKEEKQRDILGDQKYEAWKAGEITLSDLNARTYDADWGGGRKVLNLEDAKQVAADRIEKEKSNLDKTSAQPSYNPVEDYFDHFSAKDIDPSKGQMEAVRMYKLDGGADVINSYRERGQDRSYSNPVYHVDMTAQEASQHLDSLISKTPLQEPVSVYRGVRGDVYKPDSGKFISTSTDIEIATGHGDTIVRFDLDKGTKALPVDVVTRKIDNDPMAKYLINEREVLIGKDNLIVSAGTHYDENLKKEVQVYRVTPLDEAKQVAAERS